MTSINASTGAATFYANSNCQLVKSNEKTWTYWSVCLSVCQQHVSKRLSYCACATCLATKVWHFSPFGMPAKRPVYFANVFFIF